MLAESLALMLRSQVFQDLDFTLLEMNPFTLDSSGAPFPLDMRGELDDTAAFKSAKKWGALEFPLPFGRTMSSAEEHIHSMDEATGGRPPLSRAAWGHSPRDAASLERSTVEKATAHAYICCHKRLPLQKTVEMPTGNGRSEQPAIALGTTNCIQLHTCEVSKRSGRHPSATAAGAQCPALAALC